MRDLRWIARIGGLAGEGLGNAPAPFGQESSIAPLSEDSRPPSNAAVTFLRATAGRETLCEVHSGNQEIYRNVFR